VNYTFFNDLDIKNIDLLCPVERRLEAHREKLKNFGITCPPDCFCLRPGLRDQIIKYAKLSQPVEQSFTLEEIRVMIKSLLKGYEILKPAPHTFHHFLKKATYILYSGGEDKLADKLVAWDELYCKNVPHPNSEEAKKYLEYQSYKGKLLIAVPKTIFVNVGVGIPMVKWTIIYKKSF
jgi:hypothetical protein